MRCFVLLTAVVVSLMVGVAPAAAQSRARSFVAQANGVSARSSATDGEIHECDPSGCTSTLGAPARPPAEWRGELPVTAGTVIDLDFGGPVEVHGASFVDRSFGPVASGAVTRVDDARWRVTVPRGVPERAAVAIAHSWSGRDERGSYDVHFRSFIGLVATASFFGVIQQPGRSPVFDLEARTPMRVDARLVFGAKTLGATSVVLAEPRRLGVPVPLSSGARRLLRQRRRLKATLVVTTFAASGDPLRFERRVTLRAKAR